MDIKMSAELEFAIKLVMPGMVTLIAFLLHRLIARIDLMLDRHESKIEDHEVRISVLEEK